MYSVSGKVLWTCNKLRNASVHMRTLLHMLVPIKFQLQGCEPPSQEAKQLGHLRFEVSIEDGDSPASHVWWFSPFTQRHADSKYTLDINTVSFCWLCILSYHILSHTVSNMEPPVCLISNPENESSMVNLLFCLYVQFYAHTHTCKVHSNS